MRPGSPSRGRYFIKNPFWNALFYCLDFLLRTFLWLNPFKKCAELHKPSRVLLVCPSHLGDVVMSTAALRELRQFFPDVEIGVLVGGWSRKVLENHPAVTAVHCINHWKLNRAKISFWQKIKCQIVTSALAYKEVRMRKYDTAIVLHPYFPNLIPFVFCVRIPVRIGYATGGFGPLLTHSVAWNGLYSHLSEHQAALLNIFRDFTFKAQDLLYDLPVNHVENKAIVGGLGLSPRSYVVIHMGSGSCIKEWPLERWGLLKSLLIKKGYTLVFTGQGEGEKINVERVIKNSQNCINLCGVLSGWSEFVAVIQQAKFVVSVDTVAGHVASAFSVPYVVLMTGLVNPDLIRPLGKGGDVIIHKTPCSPCYRANGCIKMDCVRQIGLDRVFTLLDERLKEIGG